MAPLFSLEEINILPVTLNISKQRTQHMQEINFMREASLNNKKFPIIDIEDFKVSDPSYLPNKFD